MFISVLYVGDTELQCVPGSFGSVQQYVNVFEPLLFEECRAQLHSTWEELCDGVTKDPHIEVCVKSVKRRERGTHFLFFYFKWPIKYLMQILRLLVFLVRLRMV